MVTTPYAWKFLEWDDKPQKIKKKYNNIINNHEIIPMMKL